MARRAHGTGSVYYDASKDRWVGTYEAGFTTTGTRRRRKITATTERGARQKLLAAIRAAEEAEAPTTGGHPTVKRWADTWLENTSATLRPTTWQANRSLVTRWIVPTIGHRRLDQLSPADIRALHRAMLTAGLATSSVSRAHSVLQKMLTDAFAEGYAVPQRAREVDGPGVGETDRDAIPLPDALAILAAASARPDASRWVAALLQGMRPAECLGLTWDAVDLDAGAIDVSWQLKPLPYKVARDRSSGFRVPAKYTARQLDGALHLVRPKTASGQRIIPIVPWMAAALIAWRDASPTSRHGLVWPRGDGRPQTDAADRQAWADLCDAAQVAITETNHGAGSEVHGRRPTLYEGRHTAATLLREARVDDATIVEIMGHATILSTKAYLHTDRSRTRAALDDVAGRLGLTAG